MPVALPPDPTAPALAAALAEVRAQAPLVQCLTNHVVSGFTANLLLALGAAPAMVDVPGEAAPFAGVAGGVLINLGTPHAEQRAAMREAAVAAPRWVLDPVAVGALPVRTDLAQELLAAGPSIVRGNASEIAALAGHGHGGRGVDATAGVDDVAAAARELAGRIGAVVAVSGPVDLVTDGHRSVRIHAGHALLTRVTGGGCALGAAMAAHLAVTDPFTAAVAASLGHGLAAEHAAAGASGPGTFAVRLLDAVAALGPEHLAQAADRVDRVVAA
ncbi:hydroxyethylthiazole kinase [Nocardioides sp.]|uniref:hydroxyethylthiazole kinase n=1 Tax=Nocardioides sp. TaxID=35761 RepID=UPI0035151249